MTDVDFSLLRKLQIFDSAIPIFADVGTEAMTDEDFPFVLHVAFLF